MKRVLIGITVVAALLIATAGVLLRRLTNRATMYPCIETSKAGWLTAVAEGVLVRVEWDDGVGKTSVTFQDDPVTWKQVGTSSARLTAMQVLRPSSAVGSSAVGKISLYVSCDGVGTFWAGETTEPVPWRDCLKPEYETRLQCVQRAIASRRGVDRRAGELTARIMELALASGLPVLAAPVPPPAPPVFAPPENEDEPLAE